MTPQEFIDENYFNLTIDCKREISEIYQALEDYAKTKQLTLTDVVKSFYCWDEQALGKERRCQEECETCANVRKEK
tara:strand:- start:668 stop:895 length:228 start_codon:yes stop_codon:yes gene_type:complete